MSIAEANDLRHEIRSLRAEIERLNKTAANKETLLQIACDDIERLRAALRAALPFIEHGIEGTAVVRQISRALEGK